MNFENRKNGGVTWMEMTVQTSAGVKEGDKAYIKLPRGWTFTEDKSSCIGRTSNLNNVLPCVVFDDAE